MDFTTDNTIGTIAHQLRARTRALHEQVDALFSRFDLGVPSSYGNFLKAQYRAVAAAEAALAGYPALPAWRPRVPLIADDLGTLGHDLPEMLRFDFAASEAKAHGVLYVLEGSRLGGRLLVRSVKPGFPTSFLADGHHAGEWKRLIAALNHFARESPAASDAMLAGARAGFALFLEAALVTQA